MILQIKKMILTIFYLPNWFYNRFVFWYKKVSYKTFPKIIGRIFISGYGTIKFGEGVGINSNLFSNPIGGDTRTVISVDKGASLIIGDFTGFSNIAISCKERITIGNHVKIGGGVKIYDSDFHALDFEDRKNKATDIELKKPVVIEDGCFIGAHSIILKGVTIGKESIIGAGSVVTKSVPEKEIWGGNPAKMIRKIN